MARFRHTAKFAGKGKKDLEAQAMSLVVLGEPFLPRNPEYPLLALRNAEEALQRITVRILRGTRSELARVWPALLAEAVTAAEARRGVKWDGARKCHVRA